MMNGEAKFIPQEPRIETQAAFLDQIPKELAVLHWENFLKRFASDVNGMDMGAYSKLRLDIMDSAVEEDTRIPKTLHSTDIDRSFKELEAFLNYNFNPIESYLFKEKLVARPKNYETMLLDVTPKEIK